MNLAPLEQINNLVKTDNQTSKPDALRQAARQFEAILLTQLTSALKGSDDDEDSLFGSDGGSGLAKQLFSEQMATTMANSGGVGLSDLILQQFGGNSPKNPGAKNVLANVVSNISEIKSGEVPNEKISVAANEVLKNEAKEKSPAATRPRIVPDYALTENPINSPSNKTPAVTVDRMNFQMPVKGRISSGFGNRFHPIDKIIKFHAGIDIAAPKGTTIGASAEGVVTYAGWRKGYGNLVIIRHPDGRETRYGHAEKLFVKEGDPVFAGQPVAAVGSTGKSTGPHLHFEVRENGTPVDPRNFLSNVLLKNADR